VHRPAGAQHLGRIEMRRGQHQVQPAGLRHQFLQVAADQRGQLAGLAGGQRGEPRLLAAGQFQRHHAQCVHVGVGIAHGSRLARHRLEATLNVHYACCRRQVRVVFPHQPR